MNRKYIEESQNEFLFKASLNALVKTLQAIFTSKLTNPTVGTSEADLHDLLMDAYEANKIVSRHFKSEDVQAIMKTLFIHLRPDLYKVKR